MTDSTPLILYNELAAWWPLLSAPEDYREEAELYRQVLQAATTPAPRTLLELGSGGGNNASFLKPHFDMTLVDLSPEMLAVSRALNPECPHHEGDMRSVRLAQQFDGVFVHDAIMYMLSEDDLRAALETAFIHCRPGGVALFVPDCTRESYHPKTEQGGHDDGQRGLRYLMWEHPPRPDESVAVMDFVYLLRDGDERRVLHEQHRFGLFGRATWLRLLHEVGFVLPDDAYRQIEIEGDTLTLFVGHRPA